MISKRTKERIKAWLALKPNDRWADIVGDSVFLYQPSPNPNDAYPKFIAFTIKSIIAKRGPKRKKKYQVTGAGPLDYKPTKKGK